MASCFALMFFLLFRGAIMITASLRQTPSISSHHLFKRIAYDLCCLPELPPGPYPPSLDMAPSGTNPDGSTILSFSDVWGERQLLFRLTDLCDRAGCHCEGEEMLCFNYGYVLFENALYEMYRGDCENAYWCQEEASSETDSETENGHVSSSSSSDTWSSTDSTSRDVDWAAENAQLLRNYYASIVRKFDPSTGEVPNRLNNGIPCLAGQAAGWVFANGASGQCCPGYSFNALTASEAYVLYGLPIGSIVAGVRSIGMCLKVVSG